MWSPPLIRVCLWKEGHSSVVTMPFPRKGGQMPKKVSVPEIGLKFPAL